MMRRRILARAAVGACLAMSAAGGPASARERPSARARVLKGTIVQVSDGELIIDLGSKQGLPDGARLQLYRRLEVTHPRTGKKIEDRFPIGAVKADEVGHLLTIVRDRGGLRRKARAGDFAVYEPAAERAAPPEAPVATEPAPSAPSAPADVAALDAVLRANMGRSLPERIRNYEGFLAAFPESERVDAVGHELVRLRELLDGERRAEVIAKKPPEPAALTSRYAAPARAMTDQPLEIEVAVVETERVEQVRLFTRRTGAATYDEHVMARDGDHYWRLALPKELVSTPGRVEYYVEAVRTDAALQPLVGRADRPASVALETPVEDPERRTGRSRAEISGRWVDFNTGGATDRYYQAELDFAYLVDFWQLRLFRVGVGTINGEGGSTDAIDAGEATRTVALGYGYAETELGFGDHTGLALRIVGGNHHATEGGEVKAVGGVEGRFRFGRVNGTRLVVGGSLLEDVGNQAFTDLYVEAIDGVPLRAGVAVTNLPVNANLGVQLTLGVGWKVSDNLTWTATTGWNARTIRHYGFTAGSGLVVEW